MNKKITIVADIFSPDIGGPATYSQKLAEELVKKSWQVNLICYSDIKQEDDYNFSIKRIIRSNIKGWHHLKYFLSLFWLAIKSDVIYAMGPVSAGLPAMWVSRLLRKKLVVKVVGDYAWEQARNSNVTDIGIDKFQTKKFGGKIGKLKKIESKVCKSADKVITPSKYLKGIVNGWGVDENKIEVIYNAVEIPNVIKKSTRFKNIASIGRLVSWKGFELLIKLMPELLEKDKDFRLFIFGSGPEKEKLEKLITELNLINIISLYNLPCKKLISSLIDMNMFVLNTGYEGLPHTVLEAMSAGVPVVTTNLCGNPEIVQDGYNGLLVEYNNKEQIKEAILKLYNNPELGEKFVNNSKEVLKNFKFEDMINNTEKLLREI